MELSPLQRVSAFVVVVLVLVGLFIYLFVPGLRAAVAGAPEGHRSAGHRTGRPASVGTGRPASAGTGRPASAGTGTSGETRSPAGAGKRAATPDIYQWLPFTPSGLASAARVTLTFAVAYGTYSYTESTSAYLAPMRPLVTSSLALLIGRAYATTGVASARTAARQVARATAVIDSLRAFGPGSMTFVVALTQRVTGAGGSKSQVTDYAVTLTGSGSRWQVSNVQLASVGNP